MARKFSQVTWQFWTGETGRKLRDYPDAQRLALYLLTCRDAHASGLFYVNIGTIAGETGLHDDRRRNVDSESPAPFYDTRQGVRSAMATLVDEGFCGYDDVTGWVLVTNYAPMQIGANISQKMRTSVQRQMAEAAAASPAAEALANRLMDDYGEVYQLDGWRDVSTEREVNRAKSARARARKASGSVTDTHSVTHQTATGEVPGKHRDKETKKQRDGGDADGTKSETHARAHVAQPVPKSRDWEPMPDDERAAAIAGLRPDAIDGGTAPRYGLSPAEAREVVIDSIVNGSDTRSDAVRRVFAYYQDKMTAAGHRPAQWSNVAPRIANCLLHWERNGCDTFDEMRQIIDYAVGCEKFGKVNSAGQLFGDHRRGDVGTLMDRLATDAHEWRQKSSGQRGPSGGKRKERVGLTIADVQAMISDDGNE